MSRISLGLACCFVTAVSACAGPDADAPLTVTLGLTHAQATSALHDHQFCRDAHGELDSKQELFPRCGRAAAEIGDAWVSAIFAGDKLVELRRWERFGDDDSALARWNQLVAARAKTDTADDKALDAQKIDGSTMPGTRAAKGYRTRDGMIVGVYLLKPSPPENAALLEKITLPK